MINPNWREGLSGTVHIKGVNGEWTPVGEIKSVKFVEPVELKPVKPLISGTIILDDFQAPSIKQLLAMNDNMDITVIKSTTKAGVKPLRSHKKRLVKKWRKKNILIDSKTTYKNCTITGGDF